MSTVSPVSWRRYFIALRFIVSPQQLVRCQNLQWANTAVAASVQTHWQKKYWPRHLLATVRLRRYLVHHQPRTGTWYLYLSCSKSALTFFFIPAGVRSRSRLHHYFFGETLILVGCRWRWAASAASAAALAAPATWWAATGVVLCGKHSQQRPGPTLLNHHRSQKLFSASFLHLLNSLSHLFLSSTFFHLFFSPSSPLASFILSFFLSCLFPASKLLNGFP